MENRILWRDVWSEKIVKRYSERGGGVDVGLPPPDGFARFFPIVGGVGEFSDRQILKIFICVALDRILMSA